jgi:hypothetical protein
MYPGWFHGSPFEIGLQLLFALLIAHVLGDYPLQTDFMVRGKNRQITQPCPDLPTRGLWLYCLSAHAIIHAGGVWAVTGSATFGAVEFVTHWLVDWLKIERKIGFHADQALHLVCKVIYVVILV